VTLFLRGHRIEAALAVSAPAAAGLLGNASKLGYDRARPPVAAHLVTVTDSSLQSGHALDATVVVGVLALVLVVHTVNRWRRAAIVALATVTIAAAGLGRLYLGVHWATDVVTGWLLGAAWVALCAVVLLAVEGHHTRSADARASVSRWRPTTLPARTSAA